MCQDCDEPEVVAALDLTAADIQWHRSPDPLALVVVPAPDTPAATGGDGKDWPVLDDAALYGVLGDTVRAFDPHTEADPAGVLLSLLAAAGNAAGPGPHLMVGPTRHGLRCNVVLVGATSGGRKGTAWSVARSLLDRADAEWAAGHVVSGLSSGEGLIEQVRDSQEVRTGRTRSGDAAVVFDEGVTDKRLCVIEPEFSSVLRLAARDGNILAPVVRQCWDDGNLRTMVKHRPARATGAHVTVIGHAVAEEVRRYLVNTEIAGGTANRFLFGMVRRSKTLPHGGAPFEATITALAGRLGEALAHARTTGRLGWDSTADIEWARVYPALSAGRPGLWGAVCARAEAQVLRLAAVYAVLDCSDEIRPPHLTAALAVWQYCEASARWIFGDKVGDETADTIADALRGRADGLDRTAISKLFGNHAKPERIDAALAKLAALGQAEKETIVTGGRPAERWRWTA